MFSSESANNDTRHRRFFYFVISCFLFDMKSKALSNNVERSGFCRMWTVTRRTTSPTSWSQSQQQQQHQWDEIVKGSGLTIICNSGMGIGFEFTEILVRLHRRDPKWFDIRLKNINMHRWFRTHRNERASEQSTTMLWWLFFKLFALIVNIILRHPAIF